jgi:hypothetical protein
VFDSLDFDIPRSGLQRIFIYDNFLQKNLEGKKRKKYLCLYQNYLLDKEVKKILVVFLEIFLFFLILLFVLKLG